MKRIERVIKNVSKCHLAESDGGFNPWRTWELTTNPDRPFNPWRTRDRRYNLGILEDAIADCDKALEIKPDAPDAAWVSLERWSALTEEQQEKFPLICPDFAIELREAKLSRRESRADALRPLQEKMQEYLNSGLHLGWLINPQDGQVEIYRASSEVEIVQFPVSLSGGDVLPGFVLNLQIV